MNFPDLTANDVGPCPGPEVLAAWLDGDRRRDLTEHLVDCAECRADALAAGHTRRDRAFELALERVARDLEPMAQLGPCPSPVVVASWTGGDRAPGLLEHWADCPPCRADLLAAARVEFDLALDAALSAQPWRDTDAARVGGCPSPDAIAFHVEAGELEQLEDHLAACHACRADALAAAEILAADVPQAVLADPTVAEPELAKILSFSRRSRRLKRVSAPPPASASSGFAPAIAVAAAVLLAVCAFALRPPTPGVDQLAETESVRFAWAPEERAPKAQPKQQALPAPQTAPADSEWESETDFDASAWTAWSPDTAPSDAPLDESWLETELAQAPKAQPVTPSPTEPQRVRPTPEATEPPPAERAREVEREPEVALAKARDEVRGLRVRRAGKRLEDLERFQAGDRIFASRSGGALRAVDGLTFYLAPRSELCWRADGVELVRGRAFVRSPTEVRVSTQAGSLDVNGEALLAVKGRQAGIQVVAGTARYTHAKGNLALHPGNSAVVSQRRGGQLQPALPQAPKWLAQLKGNLREPLPRGLGGRGPVGDFPGGAAPSGGSLPPLRPGGATPPAGTPPTQPGGARPPNGAPPRGQGGNRPPEQGGQRDGRPPSDRSGRSQGQRGGQRPPSGGAKPPSGPR